MSDRLYELAKQAGLKHEYGSDYMYIGEFDYVKFANLIIEESITVMVEKDYHGEWLGEEIKKHFKLNVDE